jgi:hypothetical protein
MTQPSAACATCGAPRQAGLAACKFCKTVYADAHRDAVPCPRCAVLHQRGAQRCLQCATWLVVQCVFCSALSPHNAPACKKCNEPFAGAPERLAARRQAEAQEQALKLAGTAGGVAASFLGAMAGAAVSSDWGDRVPDANNAGGGLLDELLDGDSSD